MLGRAVDDAVAAAIDADDPRVVSEVVAMREALAHRLLAPPDGDARSPRGLEGGFDAMYDGTPPWDIGRPQPVFQRLADAGAISGRVLDVGCGTGEHALLAASLGLDALGVDTAPSAVAAARRKAGHRGLPARFLVQGAEFETTTADRRPRAWLATIVRA